MSIYLTIDNKAAIMICGWIKINGTWREIDKVQSNVAGIWREGFSRSPYGLYVPTADTIVKYDYAGNIVWEYEGLDGESWHIVTDPDGYVYAGGREDIHKINPDGTRAWKKSVSGINKISAIAVGPDGEVVITGYDSSVTKLNSSGTQLWRLHNMIEGEDAIITTGGTICVAGRRPSGECGGMLFLSNGTVDRFIPIAVKRFMGGVATDGDGSYFYFAMRGPGDYGKGYIEVYDSAGDYRGRYEGFDGYVVYGPAFMSADALYAVDNSGYLYKLSTTGFLKIVWAKQISNGGSGLRVMPTPDGHIWVKEGLTLHKLDSSGDVIFKIALDQFLSTSVKVASDPGRYGTFPDAWA